MKKAWYNNIGPATLIAAAFIGPGTVTVCSIAGSSYGFTLLWAIALSVLATIVLQEMSARLGLVTGQGLGESLRNTTSHAIAKYISIALVLLAIIIGNAAYEAGNLSGGAMGAKVWLGEDPLVYKGTLCLISILALGVLWKGKYKWIEKILIVLVLLMSISFCITAFISNPDWPEVFRSLFTPQAPDGSALTIIGLIGTTVVPYNLFLHASLVSEKWNNPEQLSLVRKDIYISIILGGLVSMCIVICAASLDGKISNVLDMAKGLELGLGAFAKYLVGLGLLAAGLTSAITAPMAAGYAAQGILGWDKSDKNKFRAIAIGILLIGLTLSLIGYKPITVIQAAQIANGLLLPIIAGYLIWVVNQKSLMGQYTNNWWQNTLGVLILLCTIMLGAKSLWSVLA